MTNHQAAALPAMNLTYNETLAPGFVATYNAEGRVIAVHTFGLAGDYEPTMNRGIRHSDR